MKLENRKRRKKRTIHWLLPLCLLGILAIYNNFADSLLSFKLCPASTSVSDLSESPLTSAETLHDARLMKSCTNGPIMTSDEMTLPIFIDIVLSSLAKVTKGQRPLVWVASNFDHLTADRGAISNGSWTEFGIYSGGTLQMAHAKLKESSSFKGVIAGFDSFEGLPAKWRQRFEQGAFAKKNLYEIVRNTTSPDVEIYKGWFQDTIGQFIIKHSDSPSTLIHHDGDLFVSTAITFALMNQLIAPGTILCFDELMGYPTYEQHEILSLFIWMKEHRATLCPLAVKGPVKDEWKNPSRDIPPQEQSACFQVLHLDPSASWH